MTRPSYKLEDISSLQRVVLGVLALGLPPASLAKDTTLRLDVLAASVTALEEGQAEEHYLDPAGGTVTAEFDAQLTAAVIDLDKKGIISLGAPPGINVAMMGGIGDADGWRRVNFEQSPRIFDKYLAHECLEALLRQPEVHRYLMRKYGESSEVWQRLMREGYASGPGP
jgi:hypothetical protein